MKAIALSEYAHRYLMPYEAEEIDNMLPCECYETDERAPIDNTFLIALEGMNSREQYIHRDMLDIVPF